MELETITQLAGIVTLIGAALYAVADVLLLAHNIGPRQEIPVTAVDFGANSQWKRRARILECMSKIPWRRLKIGGLLGVFMTPFAMTGAWVLYHALEPAGQGFAIIPALLWLAAYPIGAFIHGSFIYLGAVVQAWNEADGRAKLVLENTVQRLLRVLMVSYVMFATLAVATSGAYAIAVAQGTTALPQWMAAANPVLMTIVYMLLARCVVPLRIMKYVQGAGFNIVYIAFFGLLLAYIW